MDTATNNGASKASDFQPPTRNPQQAPGQVFPEQNNVQEGSQTELLDNNNAHINVPVNPAPARPAITEARRESSAFILLAAAVLIVLLVLHAWYRRKKSASRATSTEQMEPVNNVEVKAEKKPLPSKTASPKKKAARKAAKKRKRTRK
jgi:hypothetical protein